VFWGVSYQASEIFKKPEGVEFFSLALGRSREHFSLNLVEGAIFVAGILVLGFFWWIPVWLYLLS